MTTWTDYPVEKTPVRAPTRRPRTRYNAAIVAAGLILMPVAFVAGGWIARQAPVLGPSPLPAPATSKTYTPSAMMMTPQIKQSTTAPEVSQASVSAVGETAEGEASRPDPSSTPGAATNRPLEETNAATGALNRYEAAKVQGRADEVDLAPGLERAVERAETNEATRRLNRQEAETVTPNSR